ncbi:uncharacterized protein LOC120641733 isoform X2 [Panicum virgatum]|uniref:Uncharacterized protein n=1 Tax=Panicum virgatum TaxID=38727 RepID=A0A8T0QPH4_PANVG|nr:uncharacterized protein LOC120641733 isoform X2 [Panicum virgatum]KAG2574606.1 hypothetical protein PVAP13_7KG344900 [Panicum virgatum]
MLAAYPCFLTLIQDVLFLRTDHARDYVAWKVVQHKAAKMVKKMAYEVPELKDKLHLPRRPNNLYHVVSIGSSFPRRRVVKNLGRQQATDIARVYLQLKKRLPSSSQGESNGFSASELDEPLIALLDFPLLQMLDREKVHLTPLSINPRAENSSKQGVPPMQMLAMPPFVLKSSSGQVHQFQHSPKQDALQSSAAVAFAETTKSAMKLMSSQESPQDAARPGTREYLNGPQTTNLS